MVHEKFGDDEINTVKELFKIGLCLKFEWQESDMMENSVTTCNRFGLCHEISGKINYCMFLQIVVSILVAQTKVLLCLCMTHCYNFY